VLEGSFSRISSSAVRSAARKPPSHPTHRQIVAWLKRRSSIGPEASGGVVSQVRLGETLHAGLA